MATDHTTDDTTPLGAPKRPPFDVIGAALVAFALAGWYIFGVYAGLRNLAKFGPWSFTVIAVCGVFAPLLVWGAIQALRGRTDRILDTTAKTLAITIAITVIYLLIKEDQRPSTGSLTLIFAVAIPGFLKTEKSKQYFRARRVANQGPEVEVGNQEPEVEKADSSKPPGTTPVWRRKAVVIPAALVIAAALLVTAVLLIGSGKDRESHQAKAGGPTWNLDVNGHHVPAREPVNCTTQGGEVEVVVGDRNTTYNRAVLYQQPLSAKTVWFVDEGGNKYNEAVAFDAFPAYGEATTTKDGDVYKVSGTAYFVSDESHFQGENAKFELEVTCPSKGETAR